MFSDMFAMPQTVEMVGEGSEANPIHVPNVAQAEFDIFVSQAYGK
jgi:hypothetical protein